MHLNYFFLKHLCVELNTTWAGFTLGACFSQQKEELIFHFFKEKEERFLRASLVPQLTFVTFADSFARTKKNSVDLFEEAVGGAIEAVEVVPYDRSFTIRLSNGFVFLFKLHGSRSNIIGTAPDGVSLLFRSQLTDDEQVTPEGLAAQPDLSRARFDSVQGDLRQYLPMLGKEALAHLENNGYLSATSEQQWQLLSDFVRLLESPSFHICRLSGKIHLLLFEAGDLLMTLSSPIEAAKTYAQKVSHDFYLKTELHPVLQRLRKEQRQTENYLAQAHEKYAALKEGRGYAQLADVLMANLHQVKEGAEQVTLDNFYTGRPEVIRLRRDLSPQKNAEVLYRKSKNQKIELEKLHETIAAREKHLQSLTEHIGQLEEMQEVRQIRQYLAAHQLVREKKQARETRPFREYLIDGYQVWVGTNARNNDELTLKYATKNDLWLHAKDVPGSHVVLKWKAGQNYPRPVIEQAAALAAHFSKRKSDTLCPVIFTPKKYVRKPKGSDPGAVIVEREDVLMVEPGLPG